MKRLYILRHAKADKPERKLTDDHGRPLHAKGVEDCPLIGHYLAKRKADFTQVLCSDALRTRQTATLVLEAFGKKIPIEYTSKIYHASLEQIISQVREIDDDCSSLLIVGHNPGFHQLAIHFAGDGKKDLLKDVIENFPPGSLAIYDLPIKSWFDLRQAEGKLIDFTYPKKLRAED
jgi:phosphohistidine phosphatase